MSDSYLYLYLIRTYHQFILSNVRVFSYSLKFTSIFSYSFAAMKGNMPHVV